MIHPRKFKNLPLKNGGTGRRSGFLLGSGNFAGENSLLNFGRGMFFLATFWYRKDADFAAWWQGDVTPGQVDDVLGYGSKCLVCSLHLKMDGRKMSFLWEGLSPRAMLVLGRVVSFRFLLPSCLFHKKKKLVFGWSHWRGTNTYCKPFGALSIFGDCKSHPTSVFVSWSIQQGSQPSWKHLQNTWYT